MPNRVDISFLCNGKITKGAVAIQWKEMRRQIARNKPHNRGNKSHADTAYKVLGLYA